MTTSDDQILFSANSNVQKHCKMQEAIHVPLTSFIETPTTLSSWNIHCHIIDIPCNEKINPHMANAHPAGVIKVGYISDISLFVFKPNLLEKLLGAPMQYATQMFPMKARMLHSRHVPIIIVFQSTVTWAIQFVCSKR
jgi:hypothetical protein